MNPSYTYENNNQKINLEFKIKQLKPKIIQSIKENLVTFISSKTGSGKSTQVPQYLYNYLEEKKKNSFCVICSEPRAIACETISNYIRKNNKNININTLNEKYFDKNAKQLLFIKESDLLYLLKKNPRIPNCDILIIDEVHERTMKLDLILYYIKYLTLCEENIKRNFRLVLMSATFNTDDIHEYFSSIKNKNFTFGFINQDSLNENLIEDNYDIYYSNSINNSLYKGSTKFNELNMKKVMREIIKIVRYEVYSYYYDNKKTILIFLPDYKSIYSLYNILNKEYKGMINIFQFSSILNIRQQIDIMNELKNNNNEESFICNVIIATTLAETCLTFPNCDVVIDCGLKKICKYNYDANIYEEVIEYISQDSCIQRSGRCGRGKNRGNCYRIFPEKTYNLMDKYRKPEIEIGNIDLIILRLYENNELIRHAKTEIKTKGYLDFLSKIEKDKYNKINDKLIKYNAIEKKENNYYYIISNFGTWIKKTSMDIELGYYFDKFKEKYPETLKKEVIFQLLNIISSTDNYNNELFYTDIDPDLFKLILINNKKEENKKLVDLAENFSKNILDKALVRFNHENLKQNFINKINKNDENKEEEKNKISNYFEILNKISPYYYLFSKLDEIYNGKNFYTKNKIFQLGDWIITLFFTNQYRLIKCLKHNYFEIKESECEKCESCIMSKYFYCFIYSLNEKYFTTQKNKAKHIKNALGIKSDTSENNFCVLKDNELTLAKWNIIYLNLISKKPDKYISENQALKYINELKLINFDEIMNRLYEEYKKLYIDLATKYLELTKNDDEMLIQRKIFGNNDDINTSSNNISNSLNNINEINTNDKNNKILLYFNKKEKVNLMKSYFFEFIPKEIDKYFCLTKFRKILGKEKNGENEIKLSKLYFKNINPIFEEMISKSYKIKNHFISLNKEIIEQKEVMLYNNIGKYFYFHFISPKLIDKKIDIEIYHNSIVYLYSKNSKDIDKDDKIIKELINNEKENYYNMLDFIQCLKGGCLTIQLTQGLEVKNIYDTYQNRNVNKNQLLYIVEFKNDPDNKKDIKYYHEKIKENNELTYENLFILKDKLIIVFRNSLQFSLFSERQNLDIKLIPYKENLDLINSQNEEYNYNNMKIYIIKFDSIYSNKEINKIMINYKNRISDKYKYKINFFIDENIDSNSKLVYYYINSENQIYLNEKEILGEECKENLNQKIFSITWLSFTSDYDYFPKFRQFCRNNNLNIIYKKQKLKANEIPNHYFTKKFELINYSIENMKLIQNYIGYTAITLNSFAILELKSKSKDTFLEYNQNIFQYARGYNCNVTIVYYENKIIIYGEPRFRKKLYEIISKYFSELQNEKIIYNLKGKEDNLLIKTLYRKLNQKQIIILMSKNEQGEKQLEFRKKYYDIISKLLFQKKKGKSKIQIKSIRCEICLEKFDNDNNNNYFKLKLCGHKFCVECLKMQICDALKISSSSNIPLKCVKCSTIIANADIFEIIIPNTPEYNFIIDKLIQFYMLRYQIEANNKKYYWCPNKKENCNYIYNSKMKEMGESVMTCPNCNCRICLLCNNILDPNTPHNPDCQTKLYSKLSDKDRKWLLENSKGCPMCHTVYEKSQGCNHMTCTVCHPVTHFCYLCGNILDNLNPLSHFSNKESKCYNKLWDDPAKNNIEDIDTNKETSNDYNNDEDSKIYNNDDSNYNYNSYNIRTFRNNQPRSYNNKNEILTRIMIEKVSQNNSYQNSNYRNYNYSGSNNRNINQYTDRFKHKNNSYNKINYNRFKK